MKIRQIQEKDANKYFELLRRIVSETSFMLFVQDEINYRTSEQYSSYIKNILSNNNSVIFVAENNNDLAGLIIAQGGKYRKNKHCANIVIGVLNSHYREGIGSKLLETVEKWALENNIHRLELTVMENNQPAIALYKKIGFEIEGIRKHSIFMNKSYINEIYMAKIIG